MHSFFAQKVVESPYAWKDNQIQTDATKYLPKQNI